jgi:glucokinase
VLNGEIFHGASDAAGEIGHMTIEANGRAASAATTAASRRTRRGRPSRCAPSRASRRARTRCCPTLVNGRLEDITAATVYEAVVLGDPYANEVMRETAKILGAGVANMINVLNPDMVVIAGGVTRAGDHLFVPLRAEVRKRAFRSAEEACQIVSAKLPGTAGVIGAIGVFKRETYGAV